MHNYVGNVGVTQVVTQVLSRNYVSFMKNIVTDRHHQTLTNLINTSPYKYVNTHFNTVNRCYFTILTLPTTFNIILQLIQTLKSYHFEISTLFVPNTTLQSNKSRDPLIHSRSLRHSPMYFKIHYVMQKKKEQ